MGDRTVGGERLSYNSISEPWNEYLVEDGSTLRLKVVVKDIIKTDQFNSDGTPVYLVQSVNVLDARVPDHLKRR